MSLSFQVNVFSGQLHSVVKEREPFRRRDSRVSALPSLRGIRGDLFTLFGVRIFAAACVRSRARPQDQRPKETDIG